MQDSKGLLFNFDKDLQGFSLDSFGRLLILTKDAQGVLGTLMAFVMISKDAQGVLETPMAFVMISGEFESYLSECRWI